MRAHRAYAKLIYNNKLIGVTRAHSSGNAQGGIMKEKIISQMLDFCAALEANKLVARGDTLSVRYKDGMFITPSDKAMAEVKAGDIKFLSKSDAVDGDEGLHLAIYGTRPDINAVITNHAPFCVGVAASCKSLPAALDDMAQIIGPTAKVSPDGDALTVLRTLKGRNACLIRNGGVVATGRTLDEAFTGSMVLEKGALCYVGSTVIGKSVRIGLFDALLMRFVYKTKYSKKDQTAKQQELKA